nr:hypothetical protein NPLVJFJD_NPLVJFJD_CDS_0007 [Microvirus sp.]
MSVNVLRERMLKVQKKCKSSHLKTCIIVIRILSLRRFFVVTYSHPENGLQK